MSTPSDELTSPVNDSPIDELVVTSNDVVTPADDLPFIARAAICFLSVPPDVRSSEVYEWFINALQDDPRVDDIDAPRKEDNSFDQMIVASSDEPDTYDEESSAQVVADPYLHLHALEFEEPIRLKIRAPKRLQSRYSDSSEIPAETYWAVWDGVTLLVLWELESAKSASRHKVTGGELRAAISSSGGLIVQTVLRDAAKKIGYSFMTVECSTNCDYTFSHTNLIVRTVGRDGHTSFSELSPLSLSRVTVPADNDPEDAAYELHARIRFVGRAFAKMRCDSQTMIQAVRLAHRNTAQLLRLNYEHSDLGTRPFWRTLRLRWNLRSWRRVTRRYVASIRLALATLERLRGDWIRYKNIYDNAVKRRNVGVVFESEYELGVQAMQTLDVTEVRSTVEHLTESLDTRALVVATAVGAIVGAIVASLIGAVI